MRIDGSNAALSAIQQSAASGATSEDVTDSRQISLLKQALDTQKQMAEELMKMQSGKGQVLDIRV